ncbi:hypothetical protein TEA_000064 [Camellia sinensis var. sinensis]|uniref:RING-type domain-containing protein n=1 Tax=Camellia sinensis var. sinensis TaxID=542762 RepID=A0A4S4E5H5_CAMSN|nr:hypothetical protein TEA_000064 [Camellia sinensis var. sinensis]
MVMAIVISVMFLFVGIGVLVIIHICIVEGTSRRFGRSSAIERGNFGSNKSMSKADVEKLPCFDFKPKDECESSSNSPVDCAVCLDNFKVGDKCSAAVTVCGASIAVHLVLPFHLRRLRRSLHLHRCPLSSCPLSHRRRNHTDISDMCAPSSQPISRSPPSPSLSLYIHDVTVFVDLFVDNGVSVFVDIFADDLFVDKLLTVLNVKTDLNRETFGGRGNLILVGGRNGEVLAIGDWGRGVGSSASPHPVAIPIVQQLKK